MFFFSAQGEIVPNELVLQCKSSYFTTKKIFATQKSIYMLCDICFIAQKN